MVITAKKFVLFSILALAFSVAGGSKAEDAGGKDNKATASDAATGDKKVEVTDASFRCIREMKKVRGLHLDNLFGDIDSTLAVANSTTGGVYPPGSVVQIVPGEAMVKREKGFNAATKDWEFFVLDASKEGTKIKKRGAEDGVGLGGNCLSCHAQAKPEWDMICETGHGCMPIQITKDMQACLQKTDPRCGAPAQLTPEDMKGCEELKKLMEQLRAAAAPTGGQQ
jgi:hypothetical protein